MLKIPHVSRDLSIAISVLPNPHEKKTVTHNMVCLQAIQSPLFMKWEDYLDLVPLSILPRLQASTNRVSKPGIACPCLTL
jgi:hypothetical protein